MVVNDCEHTGDNVATAMSKLAIWGWVVVDDGNGGYRRLGVDWGGGEGGVRAGEKVEEEEEEEEDRKQGGGGRMAGVGSDNVIFGGPLSATLSGPAVSSRAKHDSANGKDAECSCGPPRDRRLSSIASLIAVRSRDSPFIQLLS